MWLSFQCTCVWAKNIMLQYKLQDSVPNIQRNISAEIKSSFKNNWERVISNKYKYCNMPQSCCVVGCTNRKSKGVKLWFYPVHSGSSTIKKRRRKDWLKKTDQKNWDNKTAWPDEQMHNIKFVVHIFCQVSCSCMFLKPICNLVWWRNFNIQESSKVPLASIATLTAVYKP